MPTPAVTAVLLFALILTACAPVAAVIIAGLAALFEVYLFVRAGFVS